jgi:hypothetical protein
MFPSILQALHIIHPETLVRWHRTGFRSYWRWKSRNRGGRPQVDIELRALILANDSGWPHPCTAPSKRLHTCQALQSKEHTNDFIIASRAGDFELGEG